MCSDVVIFCKMIIFMIYSFEMNGREGKKFVVLEFELYYNLEILIF